MKKFSVLIIFVFTFLSIFPFNIYVVQSEDNEIYSPMLYSFKERAEYDLVYFNLNNQQKNVDFVVKKIKSDKPSVVLLIGYFAVSQIGEKVDSIPLMLSMVTSVPQNLKNKKNVCGVIFDLNEKTIFSWMKKNIPLYDSLGLVFSVENSLEYAKNFKSVGEEEGIYVELGNISNLSDLPLTFKLLKTVGIKAIWLGKDKIVISKEGFDNLLKIAKSENIPIIAPYSNFVKNGATFSISPDPSNHGYLCGNIAIRLYNGERPEEIGFLKTDSVQFSYNKNLIKNLKIGISKNLIDNGKSY
ncbi:MAG: ABC transporter, periplasmic substrate-binding protein [candidate division TA06 bacterium 32_111]|nr:MAG: ABC transporter, periplasmic substrate-binding protein [candidate division TA06 bacterium 32_111]KUK86507.1 MAG: ABC transporter, periplasmic substrate-binding protein [candidate division TA06 bacterium 34_109]